MHDRATAIRTLAAPPDPSDAAELRHQALVRLLCQLRLAGYRFVTPTPATHRRVLRRAPDALARTWRDALGWSLPFEAGALPGGIEAALDAADLLVRRDGRSAAGIRVSSIGDDLFAHSAFPAAAADAVFLGPDTYRFAEFLRQALPQAPPPKLLVDVGTGTGAGAVIAARCGSPGRVIATDVNPTALRVARANLEAAGVTAELRIGAGLEALPEAPDAIVANPPFIAGRGGRIYRDGGGMLGAEVSLNWALEGARRLAPGGRVLLYTGSAIIDGRDALREALERGLAPSRFELSYREIDPDIFGGQLTAPGYEDVERIAAVGVVVRRR